ncbi:MAG: acetyl-CoA carboxylase biotin carboxyl carrier protein [Bacilli bacterium]
MNKNERIEYTKELIALFENTELISFEYSDSDYSLKLKKSVDIAVDNSPKIISETNSPKPIIESVQEELLGEIVSSPIVGTFYKSPAPEKPAFVKVGDKVSKGQVLCIVEAMKVMNEIECPCEGTIAEILVNDGDALEFNQAIFKIK